jgi:hypothetical protein
VIYAVSPALGDASGAPKYQGLTDSSHSLISSENALREQTMTRQAESGITSFILENLFHNIFKDIGHNIDLL